MKNKTKKDKNSVPTFLRFPTDVKRKLKFLAALKESSMTAVVTNLILREFRESGIDYDRSS